MRHLVWLIAAITNHLFGGLDSWEDADVKSHLDFFVVFAHCREPEAVVFFELKNCATHPLLKNRIEVLFSELDRLLGLADNFQNLSEIEDPLADVVVALQKIKVPRLHYELVIWLLWGFDVEIKTVVERGITSLTTVVSISRLLVFIIDVRLDENIRGTLDIFEWDVLAVHHTDSDLIVKDWLWLNIPDLVRCCLLSLSLSINVNPAGDNSLG